MANINSLIPITSRPAAIFTHGKGSYLWDSEGNKYLDFIQGWAVNCLGHSPPLLVQAITTQANALINCSPALYNAPMLDLADLLVRHSCCDRVFFANSGAEANEGAIKLARKFGQLHRGGAHEIITMEHAFHGRTLATMSASDKPGWDSLYEPKVPGRGLLLALDLQQDTSETLVDRAREQGLLINAPRPNALRFMPALTVAYEEIDQMAEILSEVCSTRADNT